MKVKVLKRFKDKHTGKVHKKGEVMEISKKRFTEIMNVGELVEEVVDKATEDAKEESIEDVPGETN